MKPLYIPTDTLMPQPDRMTHRNRTMPLLLQGCLLVLVVSIWFPGATRIGSTDGSLSFLFGLLCALASMTCYGEVARRLRRQEAIVVSFVLALAGTLILMSLLSMLYADYPLRTLRPVFSQLFGFAFIPALVVIAGKTGESAAVDRFITAMIVMSVVTSVLVSIGLGRATFSDRAEGYFKHANQLGIALSATLPLLAAKLVLSRNRYRPLILGCIAVVLLGLMKSGSKTNLVVGTVGFLLFFGLYAVYLILRKRRALGILGGIIAAPVLVQVSLMALQSANPRAYRLLTEQMSGDEVQSVLARQRLWSISFELGLAHPFGGVGAGQPIAGLAPHSHNLFVEYFRTLGVPGLALEATAVIVVLTYVISAVYRTLVAKEGEMRTRYANLMVLASAVSVWNYLLANQMSDSFGPSTAPFFWIPLALLIVHRGVGHSLQTASHWSFQMASPPRIS